MHNCTASIAGGALALRGAGANAAGRVLEAVVFNTTISSCHASGGRGGAIAASNASLVVQRTTIVDCTAGSPHAPTLSESSQTINARGHAGGLYVFNG
eukprot:2581827-Prymnesium_polylepis.2